MMKQNYFLIPSENLFLFLQKTQGKNKKIDDKVDEKPTEDMAKKNAEIQLLTVKLKKMEKVKQALNKRLAKAGLSDQDVNVNEEIEKEIVEEESNTASQKEAKENDEEAAEKEKDKDLEKIEAELKEIEVVKFKFQEDIIAMRKEHDQQMEILNFKVGFLANNLFDKGI